VWRIDLQDFQIARTYEAGCIRKTRLEHFTETVSVRIEKYEETLLDFNQNEFLSDVLLLNKRTSASYRIHKVVLASGSKYFVELFRRHPHMTTVQAPLPAVQNHDRHTDD